MNCKTSASTPVEWDTAALIDVEHGKRGLLYERLVDIAEALEVAPGVLFNGPAAAAHLGQ